MRRFMMGLGYAAAIAAGIYGGFQVFDLVTK